MSATCFFLLSILAFRYESGPSVDEDNPVTAAYSSSIMSALGRYAVAGSDDNGGGRRPLPDARRPGEVKARQMTVLDYQPGPLDEALADLHRLDEKLRRQLERDKQRMNMLPRETKDQISSAQQQLLPPHQACQLQRQTARLSWLLSCAAN
ncbi:hypothetical protein GE09DRAFT_660590 [Coniochaeta sp. 2T2.1]|nr:hypothetical protein GE09DRAFT_660590 [Coniochaeta sp. 2T2.1]